MGELADLAKSVLKGKVSDSLKPCPFCGSINVGSLHYPDKEKEEPKHWNYCRTCSSSGPAVPTPQAAARAWNQRIAESFPPQASKPEAP